MCYHISLSLSTRDVGITQVSFANNHAHDYREKGVNRTVDSLVKNGIGFSGVVYGKDGYQKQVRKYLVIFNEFSISTFYIFINIEIYFKGNNYQD